MAYSAEGTGAKGLGEEDPSKLLERLHLQDEEIDELVWEDEADAAEEKLKWLVLAKLLTEKSFSQSALMGDMGAAWNPAQEVV